MSNIKYSQTQAKTIINRFSGCVLHVTGNIVRETQMDTSEQETQMEKLMLARGHRFTGATSFYSYPS